MREWYRKQSKWKKLVMEIIFVTVILLSFEPLLTIIDFRNGLFLSIKTFATNSSEL